MSLNPIPLGQFQDRHLAKKDIPVAIVDFGAPFAPDTGYAQQLFYASVDKGGLTNSENYSNPKFDALVDQSKKTAGATRLAILKQAALIQMDGSRPSRSSSGRATWPPARASAAGR